jgi:hypothetical protein
MGNPGATKPPTPFERFREFTRRLVAVSKAEIKKQVLAYRRLRQRAAWRRRKPRG